jgi:hypothetical protein
MHHFTLQIILILFFFSSSFSSIINYNTSNMVHILCTLTSVWKYPFPYIVYVKNQNRSANIITTNIKYTIDQQSNIEETTFYYYQTLEVWKHHTMDPIMEGILSYSLASLRGNLLMIFSYKYNNSLHIPLHCLNTFI